MSTMREGVCPQCGSEDVYRSDYQGTSPYPSGEYLLLKSGHRFPHYVQLVNYVCTDCGFVASYVRQEDLLKIQQLWQRADGRKKKNDEG